MHMHMPCTDPSNIYIYIYICTSAYTYIYTNAHAHAMYRPKHSASLVQAIMCPRLLACSGDLYFVDGTPEEPLFCNQFIGFLYPYPQIHRASRWWCAHVFWCCHKIVIPRHCILAPLSYTFILGSSIHRTTSITTAMWSRLGVFQHYAKPIHRQIHWYDGKYTSTESMWVTRSIK